MKKAFYMMTAAAIALSSCSSEETTDVAKSSAITFRPTVGLNSRGAETKIDNLQQMWVSAFYNKEGKDEYGKAYFENKLFTKGTETNGFIDPTSSLVWEKDRSYKFIAIAPATTEWTTETPTITKDEIKFINVTPDAAIKNQKDLILGTATGTETNSGDVSGVTLNLEHVLSQIKIRVKNQNPNLEYTIKGIRIAYVSGSGTYTHSTATWSNFGVSTKYEVIFDQSYNIGSGADAIDLTDKLAVAPAQDCGAMLIPQSFTPWGGTKATSGDNFDQGAYISLLLNVKNNVTKKYMYPAGAGAASECGWAAVAIPIETKGASQATWKKGNKYIYTLDLSKGCGKVDPVDPKDPQNPNVVDPDGKDPGKGENIFGEFIAFKVQVTDWVDTNNSFTIDGTTGTISKAKKK